MEDRPVPIGTANWCRLKRWRELQKLTRSQQEARENDTALEVDVRCNLDRCTGSQPLSGRGGGVQGEPTRQIGVEWLTLQVSVQGRRADGVHWLEKRRKKRRRRGAQVRRSKNKRPMVIALAALLVCLLAQPIAQLVAGDNPITTTTITSPTSTATQKFNTSSSISNKMGPLGPQLAAGELHADGGTEVGGESVAISSGGINAKPEVKGSLIRSSFASLQNEARLSKLLPDLILISPAEPTIRADPGTSPARSVVDDNNELASSSAGERDESEAEDTNHTRAASQRDSLLADEIPGNSATMVDDYGDDYGDDYSDFGTYVVYEPLTETAGSQNASQNKVLFYAAKRSNAKLQHNELVDLNNQASSANKQAANRGRPVGRGARASPAATVSPDKPWSSSHDVKWNGPVVVKDMVESLDIDASASDIAGRDEQQYSEQTRDDRPTASQNSAEPAASAAPPAAATAERLLAGGARDKLASWGQELGELQFGANNISSGQDQQDDERSDEQQQQQHHEEHLSHNVYYWRLIWFILPLGATFGNLLVIMAVYLERSLQSVTNYFIVSLAFADLFVGLIVMPFAVYVLVNEVWELSDTVCDIYVAVDVTSSTASILNLVAISIDRYRAVAHPIAYSARSSSTRAILTILLVWLISCCVGAPIILGLNTSPERKSTLCILYNSTFIFWSSLTSFYVPCIIMIGLYWRIFSAIRSRTKKAIGQTGANHRAAISAAGVNLAKPIGAKLALLESSQMQVQPKEGKGAGTVEQRLVEQVAALEERLAPAPADAKEPTGQQSISTRAAGWRSRLDISDQANNGEQLSCGAPRAADRSCWLTLACPADATSPGNHHQVGDLIEGSLQDTGWALPIVGPDQSPLAEPRVELARLKRIGACSCCRSRELSSSEAAISSSSASAASAIGAESGQRRAHGESSCQRGQLTCQARFISKLGGSIRSSNFIDGQIGSERPAEIDQEERVSLEARLACLCALTGARLAIKETCQTQGSIFVLPYPIDDPDNSDGKFARLRCQLFDSTSTPIKPANSEEQRQVNAIRQHQLTDLPLPVRWANILLKGQQCPLANGCQRPPLEASRARCACCRGELDLDESELSAGAFTLCLLERLPNSAPGANFQKLTVMSSATTLQEFLLLAAHRDLELLTPLGKLCLLWLSAPTPPDLEITFRQVRAGGELCCRCEHNCLLGRWLHLADSATSETKLTRSPAKASRALRRRQVSSPECINLSQLLKEEKRNSNKYLARADLEDVSNSLGSSHASLASDYDELSGSSLGSASASSSDSCGEDAGRPRDNSAGDSWPGDSLTSECRLTKTQDTCCRASSCAGACQCAESKPQQWPMARCSACNQVQWLAHVDRHQDQLAPSGGRQADQLSAASVCPVDTSELGGLSSRKSSALCDCSLSICFTCQNQSAPLCSSPAHQPPSSEPVQPLEEPATAPKPRKLRASSVLQSATERMRRSFRLSHFMGAGRPSESLERRSSYLMYGANNSMTLNEASSALNARTNTLNTTSSGGQPSTSCASRPPASPQLEALVQQHNDSAAATLADTNKTNRSLVSTVMGHLLDRKDSQHPFRLEPGKPLIRVEASKEAAAKPAADKRAVGRTGSRRRREKNAVRRERKATKTLAIVLGIFLICWTPFFTCNIIDGICIQLNIDCRPGMMVYLATTWLGYINSCVNPIIYTIFNMEFRRAFKKILLGSSGCCSGTGRH